VAGGLLVAPRAAEAQQPGKVHQIGHLILGTPAESANRIKALRAGLRDHGYIEGKNIAFVFRSADTADPLPELAAELVRLKVDLIFAPSSTEVEAARQATRTIPIVFATHADPVGVGHVASLAQPRGNITGLAAVMTEIVTKELEILKQALPRINRIGVLVVSTAPSTRPAVPAIEATALRLGVQVLTMPVRRPEDVDAAFTTMARERVNGFLAVPSPLLRSQRAVLGELSLKHHLAGMFGTRENVEAGGLTSYSADLADLTRRAATYIDQILNGAKPADLPVEQASKYELLINLKTAKALGLTIPPALLQRADQVID
jgi:putative ABC transport system substrate-binding protein